MTQAHYKVCIYIYETKSNNTPEILFLQSNIYLKLNKNRNKAQRKKKYATFVL